MYMRCWW